MICVVKRSIILFVFLFHPGMCYSVTGHHCFVNSGACKIEENSLAAKVTVGKCPLKDAVPEPGGLILKIGYGSGNKYMGLNTPAYEITSPYNTFGSSRHFGLSASLEYIIPLNKKIFIVPELAYQHLLSKESYYIFPDNSTALPNAYFGSSDEIQDNLNILLQGKLVFLDKEKYSLYAAAGPGISFIINKDSGKEGFISEINRNSPGKIKEFSGSYNSAVFIGAVSLGASLKDFLMCVHEIFLEFNYCFDLAGRFDMLYNGNKYTFRYDNYGIRLGLAIF